MPADEDAAIEEESIKLVDEVEAATHDVHDIDYDTVGLPEHICVLNSDQRRIFEQIVNYLNNQHRQECDKCKCKDIKLCITHVC